MIQTEVKTPRPNNRQLTLVFTKTNGNEYQLSQLVVDGRKANEAKKRDKRTGDTFQWKPGSGIMALSLFFVEAWHRINFEQAQPKIMRRPRPLNAIPIWRDNFNSEGEIDLNHPLGKIRTNLIRNRIRSSLYLYRLFYEPELTALGGSFIDLAAQVSPTGPTMLKQVEQADRIDPHFRTEYDELIYLGCLLVERDNAQTEKGQFTAYFCWEQDRQREIHIHVQTNPTQQPRLATLEETKSILSSIRQHFTQPSAPRPHEPVNRAKDSSYWGWFHTLFGIRAYRWTPQIIFILGLLLGWFLARTPSSNSKSPNPSAVTAEDKKITVFDPQGRVLWTRQMAGWILEDEALLEDLDGDGINEVLIPIAGIDTQDGGALHAYSNDGTLLWTFRLTERPPYQDPASGKFAIRKVVTDKLYHSEKPQVLLLMYDAHGWGCSSLSVVNWDGMPLWNYWHPGHLTHLLVGSEDKDSQKRLILGGINNTLAAEVPGPFRDDPKSNFPRSIFVLNPFPAPAAPIGTAFRAASHPLLDWYGVISPEPIGIEKLDIVDGDYDGKNHITLWANAGTVWTFDFSGNQVGVPINVPPYEPAEFVSVYPFNELLRLSNQTNFLQLSLPTPD